MSEQETCNGKDMTVSEVITSATKNSIKSFQAIEKGSGKMKQNAYAYFKPHIRSEVQE